MDRRALLRVAAATALTALVGCRRETPDLEVRGSGTPGPPTSSAPSVVPDPPPSAAPAPATDEDPDGPAPDTPEEPPARPVRAVPVYCRDALGLAGAVGTARAHRISQLTLHHTAVPIGGDDALVPERLRGHQRFHQQQGWSDIAYHFAVDRRGNVFELRTVDAAGDTFTDYDPAGHLLIVCEGDYDQDEPTEAQLERLAELFAHGAQQHGAPLDSLGGHRDHATTACPGDRLYARLEDIRRRAGAIVEEVDVVIEPVCGDAGRDEVRALEAT